jgi:predicted esterase
MAPTPSTQKKLRVLCLHGHRTNAKVMINQTKGLRAALGDDVAEFVYLDAPNLARGPTDPVVELHHANDAPFYEWWDVLPAEVDYDVETKWTYMLQHHEETLEFVAAKMKEHGPFDVVVGFSQGAVLLTLLSMLYVQNHGERLWKVCVCAGGVPVRGAQFRHLFETPDGRNLLVPFPSIHMVGENDPLKDESIELADMFDSHCTAYPTSPLRKMVVYHDGGHKFPSAYKYKPLYEELARIIVDHCRACEEEGGVTAAPRL